MSEDDRQKPPGRRRTLEFGMTAEGGAQEAAAPRWRRGRRVDPREEQRTTDPGLEPSTSGVQPRTPSIRPSGPRVAQRDWELALKDKLTWLDEGQRREIFTAIQRQEIARAHSVLSNERERQPKNITVQRAYEAFRRLAIQDLESVLGGLQLVPRRRSEAANVSTTGQLRALLAKVDGHTPYEGLIRGSGLDRLRAIELLVELIEHGLIGVDAKEPMRALPPRDDRATMPDPEEVAVQMALMRRMPTPAAVPAAKVQLARVPSRNLPTVSEVDVPTREQALEKPVAPDIPALAPEPANVPEAAAPIARAPEEAPAAARHAEPPPAEPPPAIPIAPRAPEPAAPTPALPAPPKPASRGVLPFVVAAIVATGVAVVAVLAAVREDPPVPAEAAEPPQAQVTAPASASSAAKSNAAPTPLSSKPIQLTLDIQPAYARAYLDGVLLTASARVQSLPRDGRKYVLRVEAPGFVPHETSFEANADVRLVIALNRLPPKKKK